MTIPRIRKPHTSRRAPGLRDSDYDHEITLVEEDTGSNKPNDTRPDASDGTQSPAPDSAAGSPSQRPATEPDCREEQTRSSSASSSRPHSSQSAKNPNRPAASDTQSQQGDVNNKSVAAAGEPAIHVQQPTPFERPHPTRPQNGNSGEGNDVEAIDILWENERGALCCGIPLFASKALGNLDPSPWTNAAHKPSPTDVHTAQVPDPSWAWAWPEWRINHDDGTDKDGWEYSFAFHRKFSWHGPKWWNSFVRRRAWIRRRVKKDVLREANGGDLLQPEYFNISSSHGPAGERSSRDLGSQQSSKRGSIVSRTSIASRTALAAAELAAVGGVQNMDIRDVETLLAVLRVCRIDREKIEAVTKYLENGDGDDLELLDQKMHDVMSFFVFQASRKALVAQLTETRDRALKQSGGKAGKGEESRLVANLDAALRHADEEVRRLEYWSDIKGLAENGESQGAVDNECGWDHTWEGVDKSGPAAPSGGRLPR